MISGFSPLIREKLNPKIRFSTASKEHSNYVVISFYPCRDNQGSDIRLADTLSIVCSTEPGIGKSSCRSRNTACDRGVLVWQQTVEARLTQKFSYLKKFRRIIQNLVLQSQRYCRHSLFDYSLLFTCLYNLLFYSIKNPLVLFYFSFMNNCVS